MCTMPQNRIAHTTAFGTPVVEHCLERHLGEYDHQNIYKHLWQNGFKIKPVQYELIITS